MQAAEESEAGKADDSSDDDCPSPILSRGHSRTGDNGCAGLGKADRSAPPASNDAPPATLAAAASLPLADNPAEIATFATAAAAAAVGGAAERGAKRKTSGSSGSGKAKDSAERAKWERERDRILREEVDRLTNAVDDVADGVSAGDADQKATSDAQAGREARGPGLGASVSGGIASSFTKRRKLGGGDGKVCASHEGSERGARGKLRQEHGGAATAHDKEQALKLQKVHEEIQGAKEELERKRKEVEERGREVEEKGKEIEHKLKQAEAAVKQPARVLGELECCICTGIMAMTHSLRCGHTFCGLCIVTWLKQGKRSCPECRVAIPQHEKPNRVHACDKIIEGMRSTLTAEQIQDLDERIEEFKTKQQPPAAGAGAAGGRGRGRGRGSGARGGGAAGQRAAVNTFFANPLERFLDSFIDVDDQLALLIGPGTDGDSEDDLSDEEDSDDDDSSDSDDADSSDVEVISPEAARRGGGRWAPVARRGGRQVWTGVGSGGAARPGGRGRAPDGRRGSPALVRRGGR